MRREITSASRGFGDRFVHRTGHSIGTEVHGTGANMDNLETHDERRILARRALLDRAGNLSGRLRRSLRSQRFRHRDVGVHDRARCSGSWSGSDKFRGAREDIIQHGLSQLSGRSVLLARVVRAEQGGAQAAVQHVVTEAEIGETLDLAAVLQDAQVRIEGDFPQRDDDLNVRRAAPVRVRETAGNCATPRASACCPAVRNVPPR